MAPQVVLMELHDVGPVKIFDTAGVDERGELGEKKRTKAMNCLKACCETLEVNTTDVTCLAEQSQ